MQKVEDVLTKIADIENHAQDNQNKIDLNNRDLHEWMKEISSKLQDSNSAYKKLEYHCRFPGRGINIKHDGKFFSNKFINNIDFENDSEEDKKTEWTDDEKEIRLYNFDEESKDDESIFTIQSYEYMTLRVLDSDDGNFDEDEYFKFNKTQ